MQFSSGCHHWYDQLKGWPLADVSGKLMKGVFCQTVAPQKSLPLSGTKHGSTWPSSPSSCAPTSRGANGPEEDVVKEWKEGRSPRGRLT